MSEHFQGCSSSTTVFRQVKDKTIESKNIEPISPQRKLTLKPHVGVGLRILPSIRVHSTHLEQDLEVERESLPEHTVANIQNIIKQIRGSLFRPAIRH